MAIRLEQHRTGWAARRLLRAITIVIVLTAAPGIVQAFDVDSVAAAMVGSRSSDGDGHTVPNTFISREGRAVVAHLHAAVAGIIPVSGPKSFAMLGLSLLALLAIRRQS